MQLIFTQHSRESRYSCEACIMDALAAAVSGTIILRRVQTRDARLRARYQYEVSVFQIM